MANALIPWFGGDDGLDRHTRHQLDRINQASLVDRCRIESIVDLTTHGLIGVGNIASLQEAIEKAVPGASARLQMVADFGVARIAYVVAGR